MSELLDKLGIEYPWVNIKINEDVNKVYLERAECYKEIARVIGDNCTCDSRLISVAPEMLEALIESCKAFEFYKDEHYKKHGVGSEKYHRNLKLFNMCESKIEKATGKTWDEIKELKYDE